MAFTGCDKDNNTTEKVSITGTWQLDKIVEYTTVDGAVRVGPQTDDVSGENASLVLKSDNTFQETWQGQIDDEGQYTYSNGKLTLKYKGGEVDVVKVKTLKETTLVLLFEDDDSVNGHTIIEATEEHFSK